MLVLGPDVLAIHHLSMTNDERFEDNEEFLKRLRGVNKGVTIFGLLDLIGIVAARVGGKQARELYISYLKSKEHLVLFPEYQDSWESHIDTIIEYLTRGLSYKNALIAMVLDSTPEVEAYVTWMKKPLENRVSIKVLTPREFIRAHK